MDNDALIIISIFLILIGLNFLANNSFISVIKVYMYYNDPIGSRVIRFQGLAIIVSGLLLVVHMPEYGIFINVINFFLFIFFSIKGHNDFRAERLAKEEAARQKRLEELRIKKEKIEVLREKGLQHTKKEEDGQTVSDVKKKMWDDGSMTGKDLLEGFKDE